MKLVWIFALLIAACHQYEAASVSFKMELSENDFVEFKVKYNKVYKSEEEEKFRMMIFLGNQGNNGHIHADKLSHELDSEATLDSNEEFEDFKKTYNQSYQSEAEHIFRRKIFTENKKIIDEHNAKYSEGLVSYRMGVNKYTDMLHHEFQSTMLGLKPSDNSDDSSIIDDEFIDQNDTVPNYIDWRRKGAVTSVKDQQKGHCGACWAFAATGVLEGQYFLHHNITQSNQKLVSLSEQNLIDCAKASYDCFGCIEGNVDGALSYILNNTGIDSGFSYPYEGKTGQCRYNRNTNSATVKNVIRMKRSTELKLKSAVGVIGPVAVYIKVCSDFNKYESGVYSDANCKANYIYQLNHAMLAVGYGIDRKEGPYWLLKNSWGPEWGERGYMRLARNNRNCGIGLFSTYPVV